MSSLDKDWKGRPHHRRIPRLGSVLLLLGLLILIGVITYVQISDRLHSRDTIDAGQVVLTADPVDLLATGGGSVAEVAVVEGDRVEAGQVLAVVDYFVAGSQVSTERLEVTAPAAGIVSKVLVVPGSVVMGGTRMATMYEPSKIYFKAPLTYDDASDVRAGATAKIDVPGLGKVDATATAVQPDFGNAADGENERLSQLILEPVDPSVVANAVPGLVVSAEIDKSSAPDDAPLLVTENG